MGYRSSRRRPLLQLGWRRHLDQPGRDARPGRPPPLAPGQCIRSRDSGGRNSARNLSFVGRRTALESHQPRGQCRDSQRPIDRHRNPKDPGIIYAGTWHLPWKSVDGGAHWDSIKHGIIDDSDVFSIIVDPTTPSTVFASACSGIYKSENAGLLFKKIQGIPSTARRTRRLLQDPGNLDIVFAGTTEGLYRSIDAGKTWTRTTGPETIVNDVEIDSADPKRILIATDRGGVLASTDGGDSFHPSNRGFSARQVTAIKRDAKRPETIFVGVVNDKDWGGIFQSDNGGQNWIQRSDGLEGRDIFSLGQAHDGTHDRRNRAWSLPPRFTDAGHGHASKLRPVFPRSTSPCRQSSRGRQSRSIPTHR